MLKSQLRQYDMATRFGGEEYALILPATGLRAALTVAERVRLKIEELVIEGAQSALKLTVSLGIACIPHPSIHKVADLIREADYALYYAKRSGRNRIKVLQAS